MAKRAKNPTAAISWKKATNMMDALKGKGEFDLLLSVSVGFYTGYRMSELLKMKYSDFAKGKTELSYIEDKSRRAAKEKRTIRDKDTDETKVIRAQKEYAGTKRTIKILPQLREIVNECKEQLGHADNDFLFISTRKRGEPITKAAFIGRIKKAFEITDAAKKGVKISSHILRKTFAMQLFNVARKKVGEYRAVNTVRNSLNHSTVDITRIYLDLDKQKDQELFEDFGTAFE